MSSLHTPYQQNIPSIIDNTGFYENGLEVYEMPASKLLVPYILEEKMPQTFASIISSSDGW